MMVLVETPELPLLSCWSGGAGVVLGVSIAETSTWLVMVTTTPSSCVLAIWVWLVDVRMITDGGGEVGVGVVGVDLGGCVVEGGSSEVEGGADVVELEAGKWRKL